MISKLQVLAAGLAAVLGWSPAGAQVRSEASSSAPQPIVHAMPTATRAPANATRNSPASLPSKSQPSVIHVSPRRPVITGFDPDGDSLDFDDAPAAPGLGFDYTHLAAIRGALHSNPSSHFRRHEFHEHGSFVPIFFGGFPYYYGYPFYNDEAGYDPPEQSPAQQLQPQPQIIVIQQPAPVPQNADSGSYDGNPPAAVPAPQAEAPIPDVGNFILVRRDGRILFASVFSVVGSQLQYVTPEGIRRTLAVSDLDAVATKQMNEARGTTFEIHN